MADMPKMHLPQTASAIVNCRMLPDDNPENVLANLKRVIADTSISVECTYSSFVAPLSPLRDDVRNTCRANIRIHVAGSKSFTGDVNRSFR